MFLRFWTMMDALMDRSPGAPPKMAPPMNRVFVSCYTACYILCCLHFCYIATLMPFEIRLSSDSTNSRVRSIVGELRAARAPLDAGRRGPTVDQSNIVQIFTFHRAHGAGRYQSRYGFVYISVCSRTTVLSV